MDRMAVTSEQLKQLRPDDGSLQEAVQEYSRRWQLVTRHIDDMRAQLEEVPERWRDYNRRCVILPASTPQCNCISPSCTSCNNTLKT